MQACKKRRNLPASRTRLRLLWPPDLPPSELAPASQARLPFFRGGIGDSAVPWLLEQERKLRRDGARQWSRDHTDRGAEVLSKPDCWFTPTTQRRAGHQL